MIEITTEEFLLSSPLLFFAIWLSFFLSSFQRLLIPVASSASSDGVLSNILLKSKGIREDEDTPTPEEEKKIEKDKTPPPEKSKIETKKEP